MPEPHRSVAIMITDPQARARVVSALREEHLAPRVVTGKDFTVRGLEGAPAAAIVYDLAPWSAAALEFLKRLRAPPLRVAHVPVLLYAPPRPEVAQLLVEAGRLSMVRGEMQIAAVSDVVRVRSAIRQLLREAPAAAVFRLLIAQLPDLTSDVQHVCRFACGQLAEQRGDKLTVSRVARELGVERRTLERRFRSLRLPKPKEVLDWIVVVFAAYQAQRERVDFYASGPLVGLSDARLRRTRFRLRTLPKATGGVELVLTRLSLRIARTRQSRPREQVVFRPAPAYELAGR